MTESFPGLPARYRILRLLGQGSQKQVYLAHDESLDRDVAVAVLDDAALPMAVEDGLYEARALARISDHPDVISVFDVVESGGRLYVIGQYAPGGDLRAVLGAGGGGLPPERTLAVGLQVARALAHAHERGVIHQDVKPGNVFLDERGNALLGDLGLAAVRSRPRADADGTLSGTPGYIAPELLRGTPPSPASDLYSLGCLLYELITGRLPFASHADQLAAVPIAPARQYAPGIPGLLDDLVAGLLAPDPAQRPVSAREVAAALEGILTAGTVVLSRRGDPRPTRPRTTTRRLPRTVGRQAELAAIDHALAAARAGDTGLLLIEADAGMGKTQLIDELRARAVRLDMAALLGRGREDAAFPYLALIDALLPASSQCHALPAADAAVLRGFLSLGGERPTSDSRTEADRQRWFAALRRALRGLAAVRPLVLVLDDLQWVDAASRDLFISFVNGLRAEGGGDRLLLVAGYRTSGVDAEFGEVAARLRADPGAHILQLAGVDAAAAAEIIIDAGVARPADQLIELVHTASSGNPLFVRELVGHLQREEAIVQRRGFAVAKPGAYDLTLPGSIGSAIDGRIASASPACRDMLASAAFLRPVFTLDFLAALEERDADQVLPLLEEASARDLLVDEGHVFRFAHPLVRNAFQQRLGATRRQRMHLRLARCFAAFFPASVAEIAHHLLMAGPAADRREAIDVTRRAADDAEATFAWTEATRFLEALLGFDDPAAGAAADLHRRAAAAYYYRSDVGPCAHHLEQAIRRFRDAGDTAGLAVTTAMKYRALSIHGGVAIGDMLGVEELQACLDALGDAHPALRAHLLGAMAEVYWTARLRTPADRCAREALDLARAAGDHRACAEMHAHVSMTQGQRLALGDAIRSLEAGMEAARRGDDPLQLDRCAQRVAPLLLMAGRLDEVAGAVEQTRDLHSSDALIGPMSLTLLAATRGDLAAAEASAARGVRRLAYSKLIWAATGTLTALAYARALHGDPAGAEQALAVLLEPGRVFEHPRPRHFEIYRPLIAIYAGLAPEASAAAWLKPVGGAIDPDYFTVLQACAQIEIAHALDHAALPDSAAQVLDAAARSDLLFTPGWPFFVPRLRGLAALLRGERDGVAHLQAAVERAAALGADAECYRALTNLGHALAASPDASERRAGEDHLARAHQLATDRFPPSPPTAAAH